MKFNLREVLATSALGGTLFLGGCGVYSYDDEAYPVAYAQPGYDVYYYNGWYDGPNWYWHDRDGHYFHERREEHERRERWGGRERYDGRSWHGEREDDRGPSGYQGDRGRGDREVRTVRPAPAPRGGHQSAPAPAPLAPGAHGPGYNADPNRR